MIHHLINAFLSVYAEARNYFAERMIDRSTPCTNIKETMSGNRAAARLPRHVLAILSPGGQDDSKHDIYPPPFAQRIHDGMSRSLTA